MICFVCGRKIVGPHLVFGEKNLPHHFKCDPYIVYASTILNVKPHNVEDFANVEVSNPDSVIESNIVGNLDD